MPSWVTRADSPTEDRRVAISSSFNSTQTYYGDGMFIFLNGRDL